MKQRGKISFSRYFQTFKSGDSVAVAKDHSEPFSYSHRIQGRTGKIIEKRGSAYYIEVKELGKAKRYLLKPIHLIKIQDAKA
jgi:large subunit ribosomal protein L21e